jgi:hypothetical protein
MCKQNKIAMKTSPQGWKSSMHENAKLGIKKLHSKKTRHSHPHSRGLYE